jgi:uracil-DNA glycosylase family 4
MALSLSLRPNDAQLNVLRMQECRKQLGNCTKCLLSTGRKHLVFGAGNPSAPIMVVNSAPSWHENDTGVPLAGRAGTILKQALSRVGLSPKRDIFCTNVVKCRPPLAKNKDTMIKVTSEHVDCCKPYLDWQLDIVKPALIVIHGKFANQTLLGEQRALGQYVGAFRSFGPKTLALSTHNPSGLFGDRARLIDEYLLHWREVALRLELLGRLWRPDAACFKANWHFVEGDNYNG